MKRGMLGRGERRLKAKCCGKRSYVSEVVAEKALARIQQNWRKAGGAPQSVYQCPTSGFWHLTSKTGVSSKAKRKWPRNTGPARSVRELVLERDDWTCVVGGEVVFEGALTYNLHHRRNRGTGGSSDPTINHPSNLITVCGTGTTGCHGWIGQNPAEAVEAGFVIPLNSLVVPAEVPVLHHRWGAIFLDDEGGFEPVPHVDGGQ